jgi:hypothetical protein
MKSQNMLLPFLKMTQWKPDQSITVKPCSGPSVVMKTENSPSETNSSSESSDCWSQIQVKYFLKEYKWLVAKKNCF